MSETIALDFILNADKANLSLGELEQGYDALKEQIKKTDRSTKEGRKQFSELSTQLAATGREVKNIELSFEALDNEQVASELGSVAGAVGDVTSAFILMGGESENMQQMAKTIETAMAVSMGFKGAIEGVSSGMKLYNNLLKQGKIQQVASAVSTWAMTTAQTAYNLVVGTGSKAMKIFRIALASTGIGLIVIGIVALVNHLGGLGATFKTIGDGIYKYFKPPIDAVIDALQWLGIIASDEALAQEEAARVAIQASEDRRAELDRLQNKHNEVYDSLISDLDFDIKKRKAQGKDIEKEEKRRLLILRDRAKKEGEFSQKKIKELTSEWKLHQQLNDLSDEQIKEFATTVEEAKNGLDKAKEDFRKSGEELTLFRINQNRKRIAEQEKQEVDSSKRRKKRRDEKKKQDQIDAKEEEANRLKTEKAEAEARKLKLELDKKLEDLRIKQIKDANVRKLAELEIKQEREREALIEKFGNDTELLKELEIAQTIEVEQVIFDIEEEARLKSKEAKDKALADDLERIQKEKDERQKLIEDRINLTKGALDSLTALNNLALEIELNKAGDNEIQKEKIRKRHFERQKKLNIALATINGAQAILQAFASMPTPAAIIATVGIAATTAANILKMKNTKFNGGGGGGSTPSIDRSASGASTASGGAQINPVSNTSTLLGNQQVTVVETDITTAQNNVSVIEEQATF